MLNNVVLTVSLLIMTNVVSAAEGDCGGTPKVAVLELPSPLLDWGTIVCTPYGHVITHKEGWIWTRPGGKFVLIPAQMVQPPEELGNKAYFRSINFELMPLEDVLVKDAVKAYDDGFGTNIKSESPSKVYKLTATSSLDTTMVHYFFEYHGDMWGIWCDKDGKQCNPDSSYMLLDMGKEKQ